MNGCLSALPVLPATAQSQNRRDAAWKIAWYSGAVMVFRVPEEWIQQRRRRAPLAALLIGLLGILILAVALGPRVNWSNPPERTAGIFVCAIVVIGLLLGTLAGRFRFRTTMKRWESFSVELTPTELIRQMDGRETRIQRANVRSIREFGQRGMVIRDNLGWQIFVPRVVANYQEFRQQILAWAQDTKLPKS